MSADAGNAYRVALPEFEGPLDLLLHLCKTHEIDIVHIPIAFITEKYLEYLDLMQSMPFDVAADYLVMAASLYFWYSSRRRMSSSRGSRTSPSSSPTASSGSGVGTSSRDLR